MSEDDTVWLARAKREIGAKEKAGTAENTRILEYHAATKLKSKSDEVPWCSAFVCWVMEGVDIASTRSAAARSWLRWGKELATPQPGCIAVLTRPGTPGSGHVAFYVGEKDGKVLLLGGNQGNQVCVREYDKTRVLSYRWPDI